MGAVNNLNSTKRCPIVLCLDISPSMSSHNRIQNLNRAVSILVEKLQRDLKAKSSVEIAVVTFSTQVNVVSDFEPASYLRGTSFVPVKIGGSHISEAVLTSLRLIEDQLQALDSERLEHYIPFLILVTDGDPNDTDNPDNQKKAVAAVQAHCCKAPLIAPYIIGVGDEVNEKTLDSYAEKFTGKSFILDGEDQALEFEQLFTFIGDSITCSLQGEDDLGHLYKTICGKSRNEVRRNETIRAGRKHKKM